MMFVPQGVSGIRPGGNVGMPGGAVTEPGGYTTPGAVPQRPMMRPLPGAATGVLGGVGHLMPLRPGAIEGPMEPGRFGGPGVEPGGEGRLPSHAMDALHHPGLGAGRLGPAQMMQARQHAALMSRGMTGDQQQRMLHRPPPGRALGRR
jgi:hypothetical protein